MILCLKFAFALTRLPLECQRCVRAFFLTGYWILSILIVLSISIMTLSLIKKAGMKSDRIYFWFVNLNIYFFSISIWTFLNGSRIEATNGIDLVSWKWWILKCLCLFQIELMHIYFFIRCLKISLVERYVFLRGQYRLNIKFGVITFSSCLTMMMTWFVIQIGIGIII